MQSFFPPSLVVFGMSDNVSNEQLLAPVKDQRDQPVLISFDVEDRVFANPIFRQIEAYRLRGEVKENTSGPVPFGPLTSSL
jgi:hypothetical protein